MIYFIGNNLFSYNNIENCSTEYCYNYLKDKKVIGIDIETSRKFKKGLYKEDVYQPGLDPYVSRIVMFQIGDLENQFVIDTRVVSPIFLKDILESNEILKVGHNLKFEGKHIFCNYKIVLNNVWDTMICERILYNGINQSYSLEAVAKKHLNATSLNLQPSLFELDYNKVEELEELDEIDLLDAKGDINFVINKSTRLEFLHIGENPFTQNQVEYGVDDILIPLKLYEIQKQGRYVNGELYCPTRAFLLQNRITQTLAKIELRGIKVDSVGWYELYQKNMKHYVKTIETLNKWVETYYPKFANQIDLFSNNNKCIIQWSSSKQVVEFCKHLGICPKDYSKQTKKVEYTVGAKNMFRLLNNNYKDLFYAIDLTEFNSDNFAPKDKDDIQGFIFVYLANKKFQQLTTTFGKEWLENIHPITKRVHTNFIQLMNTGRLSSISPNLQQLPRNPEFRHLFIPEKGNKMIATDFAAQEKRVSAQVCGIQSLRDFFKNGHPVFKSDIHLFVGTAMFKIIKNDPNFIMNKKEHADERNKAKNISFKMDYGGSAYTLSKDLGITEQEGETFINAYFDAFPGLRENFEETKRLAVERGWVELDLYTKARYFFNDFEKMKNIQKEFFSHFGDKYKSLNAQQKIEFKKQLYINNPNLKKLNQEAGKLKGKLERSGLNYRIQGTGAVMTKIALYLLDKDNMSLTEGVLLPVHDEIVEEYSENIVEQRKEETVKKMIQSGTYVCPDVPMGADAAVGDYWIH